MSLKYYIAEPDLFFIVQHESQSKKFAYKPYVHYSKECQFYQKIQKVITYAIFIKYLRRNYG